MEHLKKPDRKKLKIEEDGKRRRKIIKILISTFLVVAVAAILIPVIGSFLLFVGLLIDLFTQKIDALI